MIVEAPSPLHTRSRRPGLVGRLRGLFRASSRRTRVASVVFCYDLQEGESLAEWCRRNPGSAPPADAGRVVWIVPDTPLPRTKPAAECREA